MGKGKVLTVVLFGLLIVILVFPSINEAFALPWILVGTDTTGEAGAPSSLDIFEVYYTNDATYFQFNISFVSSISTSQQNYTIYLDTKSGGYNDTANKYQLVGEDYWIVYNALGAYLYSWTGSAWSLTATLTTQITGAAANQLTVTGLLVDIGYPWTPIQDMNVVIETDTGVIKDRAPNVNNSPNYYTINYYDVPNLPWPVLPIFSVAVVVAVSLLYKYKFRSIRRYQEP